MVTVTADRSVRLKRITERDGITPSSAENRLNSQPSAAFYESRSRYILNNDGDAEELAAKVKELCVKIREDEAFG